MTYIIATCPSKSGASLCRRTQSIAAESRRGARLRRGEGTRAALLYHAILIQLLA